MNRLRLIVNSIGLEEFMNCTLVQEGVRNAMLIQPADYSEATSIDKITKGKLIAIKKEFPALIQSDINGETLISKIRYDAVNIKKNSDMGVILGYPCAPTFNTIHEKKGVTYSVSINVHLKAGYNKESVQILAYVCPDESSFADSLVFAERCESVLKKNPVVGKIISNVEAKLSKHMPISYLVEKLATNSRITEDENTEIKNHIWNLGFPESEVSEYEYKYDNPVHRGILIGLLTLCENNPIEPFFPLQHRKESAEVDAINGRWEQELIRVFKQTEKTNGGKRKTRRAT